MEVRFDTYYDNEQLPSALRQLADDHSELAELASIGKSYEGRDLWLVTLTNSRTGPAAEKPAFWVDGNIHATEVAGSMACLHLVHHLVTTYGHDARTTALLDRMAFYVLPRLNPDGVERAFARPYRYVRSGVRPYPYPDERDGLYRDDVDGDGRILEMRIPDPSGHWKVSEKDARLLVKRGPDEEGGKYYRLFPEGRIRNYDGFTVKLAPPLEGLDFNRNFPVVWEGEGTQRGAGPFPLSEAETRAAIQFISDHQNVTGAVTYHTFGGIHLRSFSFKADDQMIPEDLWVFERMGKRATELTGYPAVSTFHDFRYHPREVTSGAFDDWCYDQLGLFSWTTELWDLVGRAGIKERKRIEWHRDHPEADDLAILRWVDENLGGEGFTPWYAFEHPQLGAVELGGWDELFTWSNPPPRLLEEELRGNSQYVMAQAAMAPWLATPHLSAITLGGGAFKVTLVVENMGFLPTHVSRQALERKIVRPVRVELRLRPDDGGEVVSGEARRELGQLEGRAGKIDWLATSDTDNRARCEWVVRAAPGTVVELDVIALRAGTLHRTLLLE